MMFRGLPGGSPGPNAQATWKTLAVAFIIAAVVVTALRWLIIHAAQVTR